MTKQVEFFKQKEFPAFVHGAGKPIEARYTSLEELLAIRCVASFKRILNFTRYSVTKEGSFGDYKYLLMCEWGEGPTHGWSIIGYITEPFDLPVWNPLKPQ